MDSQSNPQLLQHFKNFVKMDCVMNGADVTLEQDGFFG